MAVTYFEQIIENEQQISTDLLARVTDPAQHVVIFADDEHSWHNLIETSVEDGTSEVTGAFQDALIVGVQNKAVLLQLLDQMFGSSSRPADLLIVLDLRFKTVPEGLDCLNCIKLNVHPEIRSVPVVMYSIGEDADEIVESFKRSAAAYSHKPGHPAPFFELLSAAGSVKSAAENIVSLRWPTWKPEDAANEPRRPELSIGTDLPRDAFVGAQNE